MLFVIRSIMQKIATLSKAVVTLLLLHLCGCRSADGCELGGNNAVICAMCSDTSAGVRWIASAPTVSQISLNYSCYNSEGRDLQLNENCINGRQNPHPPLLRIGTGTEIVSLFHMVGSTLSLGTQCTFGGAYEIGGVEHYYFQPTNCTIKTNTECLDYPAGCQLPATCASEGDQCNCHCNEGFAGNILNQDQYQFPAANCSSTAPTGSPPTSPETVLPSPTGTVLLLSSENPLRGSTLLDTYSMTTLIQPSLTTTPFLETTQIPIQGTVLLLSSENPLRGSTLLDTYSMTTLIQPSLTTTPFLETTQIPIQAAVAVVCVAALLVLVTLTVALIALYRNRCRSNRFYGLKFSTDDLDPNFQPVKINEAPFNFGSLHSIFHALLPQTGHDESEDIMAATSSGVTQCGKISELQSSSDLLKVKTGTNETLNIQNAEKGSLISQQGAESLMGSTGSIELGCLTEIAQNGSNISLRMSSNMEENATQPLATPMQDPSGGYVQENNTDQATALPMPSISTNSPDLQQESTSGENRSKMNCILGVYVQDATYNGGNGNTMCIGLEASGDMELGCLELEEEADDGISLSMLDSIVSDRAKIYNNTLPMQNSNQGYLQESDAVTFPAQPCIDNQMYSESGNSPLQHTSNDGVQNSHQSAEDVCAQSFTSGYTLQGDHCIKGKPGGLRSSEGENAVCEMPLSMLEFMKPGADGYVQQNKDETFQLPPSFPTATATPLASTMLHPSLDYVQDSNIERINTNSPALQRAEENTTGEDQSKTNHRLNCMSGDYVCDATDNGGSGAYIRDATSVSLEASGDMERGCFDLEGETNDEISLNMLDMTELHNNPLPMQDCSQGYMEEIDAVTLPLPGEHNHRIFKDKPVGVRSSDESEHAFCEVPLSMLQFANTGADGYVQQNIPQLPPSLSTGVSHDQNCVEFQSDYNSTTNTYSAAETTDYIWENTPPFSSSNAGVYIQDATAFPQVKTSLSVDSGSEEFPVETIFMSDISEGEEIQARSMVDSTMQNVVEIISVPPTLPPSEHSSRLSFPNSPTSHTTTPVFEQRIARPMSPSSGYITQSSTDGSILSPTSRDLDSDLENMVDIESHRCQDHSSIATENSWVSQESSFISPFPETNESISSQSNPTGYYQESVSSPVVNLPRKVYTPESLTSTGSNREPVLDFSQHSLPAIRLPAIGYSSDQSTPKSANSGPLSTHRSYTLPSLLTHQYARSIEHPLKPITHSHDIPENLPFKQSQMSTPNNQEHEQHSDSNGNSHPSTSESAMAADSESPGTGSRHSLLTHLHPGTTKQLLKQSSTGSLDPLSVSVSQYQHTADPDPPSMDSRHFGPLSFPSLHHETIEQPPTLSADNLPVPTNLAPVSRSDSPEFDQHSVSNANSYPLAASTRTLDLVPPRTNSRCLLLPSLLTHLHTRTAKPQTDISAHSTDTSSLSVNSSQDHPSSLSPCIPDGYNGAPSLEDRLQSNVHNSIQKTLFPAVGHAVVNTDYVDIESWPLPTFAC